MIKDHITKKKIILLAVILLIFVIAVVSCCCVQLSAQNGTSQQQSEEQEKEEEEDISLSSEIEETVEKPNKTETSDSHTSNSSSESSGNNQPSSENPDSNVIQSSGGTTVHTHVWQDHTAQRWVPNIVTVDDYETKTIQGARFYTYAGVDENGNDTYIANGPTYWFENGFTHDDLRAIIKDAFEHDKSGIYNGVYYGNYQNVSKTETVKVGSHQEDHGYEEKYVDYQYCSCGARR